MDEPENPYKSISASSESDHRPWTWRDIVLAGLALLWVAGTWLICRDLAKTLGLLGATGCLGCFLWLNFRVIKDYAAPDIVLLLTGIALIGYVFSHWSRAKWPVLGFIGGLLLMVWSAALR